MANRRACFANLKKPPPHCHGGLWLDRFIQGKEAKDKKPDLESATRIQLPVGYRKWLDILEHELRQTPDTELFTLQTDHCRIICGLGGATPWENGISLHHTWGVPYIPGSSLKGLAASYASECLDDEAWDRTVASKGASHESLFGTTEQAGNVIFHDALWLRELGPKTLGLSLDVITVHHQDYYSSGTKPPADYDSPNPIPFLTASGTFLWAITGPQAWRDAARQILQWALQEEGIGAKTSSGYGRMKLAEKLSDEEQRLREVTTRVEEFNFFLPRAQMGRQLGKLLDTLAEMTDQVAAANLLRRLLSRVPTTSQNKSQRKTVKKCLDDILFGPNPRTADFINRHLPDDLRLPKQTQKADPWKASQVVANAPESYNSRTFRDYLRQYATQYGTPSGKRWKQIAKSFKKYYKLPKNLATEMTSTVKQVLGA